MLTKLKKREIVEGLAEKFARQKVAIFSDFRGVSVAKSEALRRSLKKADAEYKVAKKTLIARALEQANIKFGVKELQGEIGIAFGYEDQAIPAKTLMQFGKENETFKILGGLLGSRILTGQEILTLARLPSREVLLSQLVGVLSEPMRGLATVLNANLRNLVVVLNKIKDNK